MEIRFGPAGLGGKEEAIRNLERFSKLGFGACEISFTYGVYLDKKSAEVIGKKAKELNIVLSIHAPYYVNLNSLEKKKVIATRKRILDCCEIGHYLSLRDKKRKTRIVFHPGYYSNLIPEEAFENIKNQIAELMKIVEENKWNVVLCPEVMGKVNVFGSIEEVARLVKDTGCGCCIDFAHILARYDNRKFDLIKKSFGEFKYWHCHFSGIVYGDKWEKHHIPTEKKEWKEVLEFLKGLSGEREVVIINESPTNVEDSVEGLQLWEKL